MDRTFAEGLKRVFLRLFVLLMLFAAHPAPTAASPRGDFCVLSVEETGNLSIAQPNGQMRLKIPLGERPHEVAVSPDGETAYVSMFGITDYDSRIGTPGNLIRAIDLSRGRIYGDFLLPEGLRGPHGLRLRPHKPRELFVNVEVGGDAMLVFDTASRHLMRRFPLPQGTHNFVFSSDGSSIFSFAGANGVTKTNAATGQQLAHSTVGSSVRGLAVMGSGNVLAGAEGEIVELRSSDLAIVRRLNAPRDGQYVYLAELPDRTIIAPSIAHGGVALFPRGQGPGRFIQTGETTLSVRVGPDHRVYVANVDDDHISVLDRNGLLVGEIGGLSHPNGLDFGVCPHR